MHNNQLITGIIAFVIFNARKLKLFRDFLFSKTIKIRLLKLCRTTGSIHLFKITEKLTPEHVKLRTSILWYILELECNEINMNLNRVKLKSPTSVTIPLKDKYKTKFEEN